MLCIIFFPEFIMTNITLLLFSCFPYFAIIIFNASAFLKEKDIERKSLLEYIKDKKSTSDFTKMIDLLVEKTKENQTFRGDYMAWGLAEQDAEKRGYNAGVADGISQGIAQGILQGAEQAKIETAKNLISKLIPVNIVAECTGLTIEQVKEIQHSNSK